MSNELRPEDQYVHIIRVPTAMFIALCMAKRFIHMGKYINFRRSSKEKYLSFCKGLCVSATYT